MAWVPGNPADGVKIKLLPSQVRAGWDAILKARDADATSGSTLKYYSLSLDNRTGLPTGANPPDDDSIYQLFAKSDGVKVEMFAKNTDDDVFQLTRGTPNPAARGHTFLPGGLILQWGFDTILANTTDVLYDISFTTGVLSVTLQGFSVSTIRLDDTTPLDKFTIVSVASNRDMYWMAIGV